MKGNNLTDIDNYLANSFRVENETQVNKGNIECWRKNTQQGGII